jgi:glycerol-3-phosphate dehydrogenase
VAAAGSWRPLGEGPLDVLVIGGGIVGAGVARDAALRGLRTGLVEQHDFASGTSSRSSRLLHGGIRYLAQGRIRMVREASREKAVLGEIAPHLVQPLAFVYPSYQGQSPARWKLAAGVKLYDALCGGRNFGVSRVLDPADVAEAAPGIDAAGLTGGVRYYDALTHDARLVLDTLRSAAGAGAALANYTRFVSADRDGDAWRVVVEDTEDQGRAEIRARAVVNAAGAWADRIPHSAVRIRPTQGVHLVISRSRLPVTDAIVLPAGRRILFAIPWGPWVTLGTTDTDVDSVDRKPRCGPADRDEVLSVANRMFPDARLLPDEIHATWAGYRALIANRRGNPSEISRRHQILNPEPGWWDVAGGKLTTYRLMAEQTVDCMVHALHLPCSPCRTRDLPLTEGLAVDGLSGVLPPPVTRYAVQHYCRTEWARHLDDVMIRRSGWAYGVPDPESAAASVATWMAETLQWDPARLDMERGRWQFDRPTAPARGHLSDDSDKSDPSDSSDPSPAAGA